MAIPALRALRNHYPTDTEIVAIGRPVAKMVLQDQAWVDRYLVYKSNAKPPTHNRRRLIFALRRERFDVILLLTNSLGTAAMAALSGSSRRIGYDRDGRGWLLTDRIAVDRRAGKPIAVPTIHYYAKVIEALIKSPITDHRMELHTPKIFYKQAEDLWRFIGFTDSIATIVVNNHAATSQGRLIPEEKLIELCKRLVTETTFQVLLHCGPSERAQPQRVVDSIQHPRLQSMSQWNDLPLGLSQAVFARAAAVITTDSGARHLAIAMNRPVITIYGATDPSWTPTFNLPELSIEPTVSCYPCWKDECPLKALDDRYQCTKQLSIDHVLNAVKSIVA